MPFLCPCGNESSQWEREEEYRCIDVWVKLTEYERSPKHKQNWKNDERWVFECNLHNFNWFSCCLYLYLYLMQRYEILSRLPNALPTFYVKFSVTSKSQAKKNAEGLHTSLKYISINIIIHPIQPKEKSKKLQKFSTSILAYLKIKIILR